MIAEKDKIESANDFAWLNGKTAPDASMAGYGWVLLH